MFMIICLAAYLVLVATSFSTMRLIETKVSPISDKFYYASILPFLFIFMNIYSLFGIVYYRPEKVIQYVIYSFAHFANCFSFMIIVLHEVQNYNRIADKMGLKNHNVYRSIFFLYTMEMMKERNFNKITY